MQIPVGESPPTPPPAAKGRDRPETVEHPSHYGGEDNPFEVIKVLRAWLTPAEFLGFLKGNAIKYTARAGKKGAAAEDHAKAAWYSREAAAFEKERSA